jgi:hypothetical protein
MTRPPVSTLRAVWMICKLGLRRKLNRWSHAMRRRKPASGTRSATPRKRRSRAWIALLLLPFSILWGGVIWVNLFTNTLPEIEPEPADTMVVSENFYDLLQYNAGLKPRISNTDGNRLLQPSSDVTDRQAIRRELAQDLADRLYLPRQTLDGQPRPATPSERERFIRLYATHGFDAIQRDRGPLSMLARLKRPGGRVLLSVAMTVALLIMVGYELGTAIRPDRGGDWEFEWFFTLPLRAQTIATAQMLRDGLTSHWALVLLLPLMSMWYVVLGLRWLALPAALGTSLGLSLLAGAIITPIRTLLYQRLAPQHRSNMRGLLHMLGLVLFFALIAGSYSNFGIDALVHIVNVCPKWVAALPWTLPASFGKVSPVWGASLFVAAIGVTCFAAAHITDRLLRNGLQCPAGARKKAAPATVTQSGLLPGMIAKELKLLVRDRSYFLQTLVVPIAVALLQLLINPAVARGAGSNIQHTAALAYGVACYAVLFGTTRLLTTEAKCLWMLHTLPQPIDRLLRQKAFMLAGIASLLTLGIVAVFIGGTEPDPLQLVGFVVLAAAGASVFAMISAGLGVQMADPLESNPQRSLSGPTMYMLMIFASLFAVCFYTDSSWTQIIMLAMFALAALAIWQNVAHAAPYLMDPTQQPPPRLQLSDALLSVFAFFTLTTIIMLIADAFGLAMAEAVTIAYTASGVLVAVISLAILRRRKIPQLWRRLGIRSSRESRQGRNRVVLGLGLGFISIAFAAGYLLLVERIAVLRELRDQAPTMFDSVKDNPQELISIAVLVVIAAPLVEEYLFRGLLLAGLRRSVRPRMAIVISAAIFAVVHPAISFPAVFVLGLLTAWAVKRTGSLLPGIVAHGVHNGAIVVGMVLAQ